MMKNREIARMSWKMVWGRPGRSIVMMLAVGAVFGMIFAMNLLCRGLINNVEKYGGAATGGKVLMLATNDERIAGREIRAELASREEMAREIEEFGGRVIGDAELMGTYGVLEVPMELVSGAIEVPLDDVPEGAVAILAPVVTGEILSDVRYTSQVPHLGKKVKAYEDFRTAVVGQTFENAAGEKYYVAGLAPGGFHMDNLSFDRLENDNHSMLNGLLGGAHLEQGWSMAVGGNFSDLSPILPDDEELGATLLAVFDNPVAATRYLRGGTGMSANINYDKGRYAVQTVAGVSPDVEVVFGAWQLLIGIAAGVIGVIAVIIVIFNSIRLVDYEKKNIELYYSLGATAGQVRAIFCGYFLWLMLGSAVVALGLAVAAAVGFSMANQELLSAQMMLSFNLANRPMVIWCGVDWWTLLIAAAGLMMAPLAVLVNRRGLGRK